MNRHHRAMQLIAEARTAVLDDAPDRPVPHFPDASAPARPARRASRRLVLAGLVPTVAVAVTAGVAVVVASSSHPPAESPPVARPAGPAQPVTAQGILLAAAEKTAASAPATGGYWVKKDELDNIYDVGGYRVLGRVEVETWYSLRAGGDVVFVIRSLGAAPATDADKAAWRAAGSPTKWHLTGPEGKQSRGRNLSAEPGPRKVSVMPDGSFSIGGTQLTYAQLRALPTDPGKLKAHLIKLDDAAAGGHRSTWTPEQIERWRVEMLFSQSWELLSQLPVSPAVRAATYRMLAGLSGLTVAENVRDAKGRTGVGISHTSHNADGSSVETQLIIDPDSGALLAQKQRSGTSLLLDARFSDATPPRS